MSLNRDTRRRATSRTSYLARPVGLGPRASTLAASAAPGLLARQGQSEPSGSQSRAPSLL